MLRLLLAVWLCGLAIGAHAEQFYGRVIVVIDGDTVLVLKRGHPLKVRLADIDAPEVAHPGRGGQPSDFQPYGPESTAALKRMVLHKRVRVETLAIDKYGRTIALLYDGKINVNEEMVRRGMAWEYSHYHSDRRFIALQQQAQQAKRGLWRQHDPTPPWQWRLRHVTGKASRLRKRPPAAQSGINGLQKDDIGRRKQHKAQRDVLPVLKPGK